MASSDQLWKEYQTLNQRYMDTTSKLEELQEELTKLSRDSWRTICTKSLHNIRNEIVCYQMQDQKLTQSNDCLRSEIKKLKADVQKLEKQRSQKK